MKLFSKHGNKKLRLKWKRFSVMLIFQSSLKIKQNFVMKNLTGEDLYNFLKSMQSDKSPGNNGLTKEFYEMFWNEMKEIFVDSVSEAKEKEI